MTFRLHSWNHVSPLWHHAWKRLRRALDYRFWYNNVIDSTVSCSTHSCVAWTVSSIFDFWREKHAWLLVIAPLAMLSFSQGKLSCSSGIVFTFFAQWHTQWGRNSRGKWWSDPVPPGQSTPSRVKQVLLLQAGTPTKKEWAVHLIHTILHTAVTYPNFLYITVSEDILNYWVSCINQSVD